MTSTTPSFFQRAIALAARERLTRYSGGAIGPYWAQLTPVVWIAFLVLLFEVLDRSAPIYVSTAVFVASGVLPYILFRQTISSLSRSVIANRYLKYFAPIDHSDLLLSSAIVEAWNMFATSMVIFGALWAFDLTAPPDNLAKLLLAYGLLFCLATSMGRLVATLGMYSDSWARSVPVALRPFFWISGIFYTATELSKSVQDILWFNPLFHVIELTREAFFSGYTSPLASPFYPLFCACILFLVSLPFEKKLKTSSGVRYRI